MKITFLLVILPCNMLGNTAEDIAAAFIVWEAARGSLETSVNFRCVSCQRSLLTWYEERKWSSGRVLNENVTVVNKEYIYNLALQ